MVEAPAQPGGTPPGPAAPLDLSAVAAVADTLPGAVVGVAAELCDVVLSRLGRDGSPDDDVALLAVALV